MWYYAEDGKPVGPLTESQIRAAVADNQISSATLLWREGLDQWMPAAQSTEFRALFSLPPSPIPHPAAFDKQLLPSKGTPQPKRQPPEGGATGVPRAAASRVDGKDVAPSGSVVNHTNGQNQTVAGPWPRFFARTLDLLLLAYVITFVFGIAAVIYFPQIYIAIFSIDDRLFGLLLVPVSMIGCAVILKIFGNTLGRWLFGIRLVRLADRPSFVYYLRRELGVWVAGLGLGIPIVTLITNYQQYRRVSRKEPASYDAGTTAVLSAPVSVLRPILGVACLVLLFGGAVFLQVAGTRDESAFAQTKSWINPVTGQTAEIAGHWEPSVWDTNSGKLYHFASGGLLIECLLGFEEVAGYVDSTDAYASGIQAALQDTLEFYGGWVPAEVNGRAALRSHARVMSDDTADVQITVLVDDAKAWRTLLFARGRNADSVDEARDLLDALWRTVEAKP